MKNTFHAVFTAALFALACTALHGQTSYSTTLTNAISPSQTANVCLASNTGVTLPSLMNGTAGSYFKIDSESVQVTAANAVPGCYKVRRGVFGTSPALHAAGAAVAVNPATNSTGDPSRPVTGLPTQGGTNANGGASSGGGGGGSTTTDASQLITGTLSFARLPIGTTANTVPAANDSRIVGAVQTSSIGVANGISSLDGTGKVPGAQLPLLGTVRETRPLRVIAVKPTQPNYTSFNYNFPASGTVTLASITGAGNVTKIQAAVANSNTVSTVDSVMQVTVDGVSVMNVPLGLFFLTYGEAPEFNSDKLTIARNTNWACGSNCNNGAWRNVNIPFTSSLVITVTNASPQAALMFSQVEYYAGVAPAGLYDPRKMVFHSSVVSFTSVAPLGSIDAVPLVTLSGGKLGILDSLQAFMFTTTMGVNFSTLEGHPSIIADGASFTYNGTEDFFGGNYYFFKPIYTAETGGFFIPSFSGGSAQGAGVYRFFEKTPVSFTNTLRITFTNGFSNEGPAAPPTSLFAFLVIYYTSS